MKNKTRLTIILVGGVFLFLDQVLKYLSLYFWTKPVLLNNFFGWRPFLNTGVAFGLPLPIWIVIFFTVPIIFFIVFILFKEQDNFNIIGYELILIGAISNLFDRIYYGMVIDYWQILTGIINLADIMIVGGLILIIINLKNIKKQSVS